MIYEIVKDETIYVMFKLNLIFNDTVYGQMLFKNIIELETCVLKQMKKLLQ